VWREAFARDYACVSPAARDQAAADNAAAPSHRVGRGFLGPRHCKQGYVWREIRSTDKVCVTPEARDRTQEENRLAWSNSMGSLRDRTPIPRSTGSSPGWTHDASSERWCKALYHGCDDERMHLQFNDVELVCECVR
jgi:hypothetical protein